MTGRSARRRSDRLDAIRRALEHERYPRVQMFVIVLLTGMAGFAASFIIGDIDAGEAGIPLFAAALIAGVVCCALFVVYAAPMLFAELLVDGILSASLYRRLRGIDRHHWLETALRRTFWPFVFAAVSVTAIGWGLAHYAPGAQTIGEALVG